MRLVQFVSDAGERRVGVASDDGRSVQVLSGVRTTYELAQQAARERRPLVDLSSRPRPTRRSSNSPIC